MPKDLVTYLQGKQQQPWIHLLYGSLVGQCDNTVKAKGFFLCYVIDTRDAVLLIDIRK